MRCAPHGDDSPRSLVHAGWRWHRGTGSDRTAHIEWFQRFICSPAQIAQPDVSKRNERLHSTVALQSEKSGATCLWVFFGTEGWGFESLRVHFFCRSKRAKAAPLTPARGLTKQHLANAPLRARHKHCFREFKSLEGSGWRF
jgi:hypothetical protein